MLPTEFQCKWVRARNDLAAAKAKADGTDFYKLWPEVKAALDALPDLGPIYRLDPITRQALFADPFAEVGYVLPQTPPKTGKKKCRHSS